MKHERYLSEQEVKQRVDLFSKMGGQRQYFDIQRLQKDYENRQKENQRNRVQADIFYSDGVRKGLAHASHETIAYAREQEDYKARKTLFDKTKTIYKNGQNLSRWLNKEASNKEIHKSPLKSHTGKLKMKSLRRYFNAPALNDRNIHRDIDKQR